MKTLLKISSSLLIASLVINFSCKEDESRLTIQDTRDITEEALTDSYYQDVDDMGGVVTASASDGEFAGGRSAATILLSVSDYRFNCNNIIVSLTTDANSTVDVPVGVIDIDFGAGCADSRGNIRTGKVKLAYQGRRFEPGSVVITTFENYSVNGVKLEGTRTSTNVQASSAEAPKFHVVLANGKATFANGAVALRESDITWTWLKGTDPLADMLVIDKSSTAEGETRNGTAYEISLKSELVYKRCGIAVSGIKDYLLDEKKEVSIDYGSGMCDKTVAITVNGITRNIMVE